MWPEVFEPLRGAAFTLAMAVDVLGVVIVMVAVIRAMARYTRALVRGHVPFPPEALRVELGRSLALALEFLLGADVLRTAIQPSWDEIARLAAIAGIRVGLNYFLDRELSEERRRLRRGASDSDDARSEERPVKGR